MPQLVCEPWELEAGLLLMKLENEVAILLQMVGQILVHFHISFCGGKAGETIEAKPKTRCWGSLDEKEGSGVEKWRINHFGRS